MTDVMDWKQDAVALIRAAALAPSSHNTQPWLFRLSDHEIQLAADRTRTLPVNDPDDRELTISCGCALLNLRVAAASRGLDTGMALLPEGLQTDLLGRLEFKRKDQPAAPADDLVNAIERRRTYRKEFAGSPVEDEVIDCLLNAARIEGAWLQPVLDEESRRRLGELVAVGDAKQWANPRWRRQLAAWIRPRRQGDGLTVPNLAAPVTRLVVCMFNMGRIIGARNRDLVNGAPLLAVLGHDGDGPHDWLVVGQALQRVLLTACSHGLQASFLNQPVQIVSLRPELQNLIGKGLPQVVLRFGYPKEGVPAAPRRPVETLIESVA